MHSASSTVAFDGGDLHAFLGAVETAASGDGGTLELTADQYRFDPISQPQGSSRRHATISDLSGVTIEGNGARVVFTKPLYGGLDFERIQGLTIRNLTIDFDPVPFAQGKITAVSDSDRTLTVRLDTGYPSLDHEMFQPLGDEGNRDLIWGTIHRPDGKFIRGYRGDVSLKFESFVSEGSRTYRIKLADRASMKGLRTGRRLTVLSRRGKPALSFNAVDQLTVESVEVNAGGGGGFATGLCTDPEYIGCRIRPPVDSNRHIGANADGFRFTNCVSSATIRDCHVRAIGDDGIVVQRTMSPVVEIIDENTVDVTQWPLVAKPGDVLDVISRTGVRKDPLPPIDSLTLVGGERRTDPSIARGKTPVTVTFSEPIDDRLAVGDLLGNRVAASKNFEVRNNRIRNLRGHCVRVATANGVVEGNVLEGATHNVIEFECESWGEHFIPKGWVADVTVRNNRISRSGLNWMAWDNPAAIFLHHWPGPDLETTGRPNENITIVENQITNSASVGMELSDARSITVKDNELSGLNQLDYDHGGYGIQLANVADVRLIGNSVEGEGTLLDAFGVQSDAENVTRSANELRIDGEAVPVTMRTWAPIQLQFNRTVVPSGGHLALAFRCRTIRLLDGTGSVILEIDIGTGNEDDIMFGKGVFKPEQDSDGTWRWFGGEDKVAELSLPEEVLTAASTLELEGIAIKADISAKVYSQGKETDTIQFDADSIRTYSTELA